MESQNPCINMVVLFDTWNFDLLFLCQMDPQPPHWHLFKGVGVYVHLGCILFGVIVLDLLANTGKFLIRELHGPTLDDGFFRVFVHALE